MKTLLSVCSARPNFVKLAAVHHAWRRGFTDQFRHVIVHTGQHYDPMLSDVFFAQLNIPEPNHNLGVKGGDREDVLKRTEDAMMEVFRAVTPDCVLVYGDVNGALGAARAAKKLTIEHVECRIAHIEAGLRSFDQTMPEELNRVEIDQLADLLFVSEQSGMDNLKKEGVKGRAELVGNTMIDTLIDKKDFILRLSPAIQAEIEKLSGRKYAIATIHRPGNVDDPNVLRDLMDFLKEVAAECPILLAAHPRLSNALSAMQYSFAGTEAFLRFDPPKPYLLFLNWMAHCSFILTDSGGIQEEATFLKKRCFTLRRNTERPSTIESGSNVLIDPEEDEDRKVVLDFARNPRDPQVTVPPLWDGSTGARILSILRDTLA